MDFKVTFLDNGIGVLECVDKSSTQERVDRTQGLPSKLIKLRKLKSEKKCLSLAGNESPSAMQCSQLSSSGSLQLPGFPHSSSSTVSSSSSSSCSPNNPTGGAVVAGTSTSAAETAATASHLNGNSLLSYDLQQLQHSASNGTATSSNSYHDNLVGSCHGASSGGTPTSTAALSANQTCTSGFSDYHPAFGQTASLQPNAMAAAAVAAAHPAAYPASLAVAAAYSYSVTAPPPQVTIINNNYNLNLNQQLHQHQQSAESSNQEQSHLQSSSTASSTSAHQLRHESIVSNRKCKSIRGSSTSPTTATPISLTHQSMIDSAESSSFAAYSAAAPQTGFASGSLLGTNFGTASHHHHHHWLSSCYPPQESNTSLSIDSNMTPSSIGNDHHPPSHSSVLDGSNASSLSSGSACSSGAASASSNGSAVVTSYPYGNAASHHPLLHYSRFSSYYHSDYHHLYNYLEPKLKNGQLIGNSLLGNQLISGQLLGNQFLNNPLLSSSTNSPDRAVGSNSASAMMMGSIEPTSGCSSPTKSACSNENDKSLDTLHHLSRHDLSGISLTNCRSPSVTPATAGFVHSSANRLDRSIRSTNGSSSSSSSSSSPYYGNTFHNAANQTSIASGLGATSNLAISCKFSEQPKLAVAMPVSPMEV